MRKIIHLDMDAFFASVEQRDFPELQGKAIAVGGSPDGRGVVATASYEARKFGVKSAMSSREALKRCPELIFIKPRFEVYKEVSNQIRLIFQRYTDLIEPLSIDEAFLDVTHDKLEIGSAIDIAQRIKEEIFNELHLTVSAGVSVNKFVAKIASDMNKPNGLTFIGPSKLLQFMEKLPIEKFYGVGKVTAQKMKSFGIFFGSDLKQWSQESLKRNFGKSGQFYYQIVRGIDDRPVEPNRISKSIGAEDTFEEDISDALLLKELLSTLSERVETRMKKQQKRGKTITLKVKFADFTQITRSMTLLQYIDSKTEIYAAIVDLFDKLGLQDQEIRLLGVSVSNFFEPAASMARQLLIPFPGLLEE